MNLYFSIGKIKTAALMHSFRVWYIQCLAKRFTHWIHPNEIFKFDGHLQWKLDNNGNDRAFAKSTSFVSKLFGGKLNASRRKRLFNSCAVKNWFKLKYIRSRLLTVQFKKCSHHHQHLIHRGSDRQKRSTGQAGQDLWEITFSILTFTSTDSVDKSKTHPRCGIVLYCWFHMTSLKFKLSPDILLQWRVRAAEN